MKSSLSIWRLLHTVKFMVKILSIFVAFSENVNFKKKYYFFFVTTLISSGSGLGPETLVLEVIPAAVTVERLGTIHETRLL